MSFFNWLEKEQAQKLKELLSEFNIWFKKNVTITKTEIIMSKNSYEKDNKTILEFGRYKIEIESKKKCFSEIFYIYDEFSYKPKVNLFFNWIRSKKLKFVRLILGKREILCFSVTKSNKTFEETDKKFFMDIKTGKFIKKKVVEKLDKFKDFKNLFSKKMQKDLKDLFEEKVTFFKSETYKYIVFLNKELVIRLEKANITYIVSNQAEKIKIIKKERASFIKEILLKKDKIKYIKELNNNIVVSYKDLGIYILRSDNKILHIDEVSDVRLKKQGFLVKGNKNYYFDFYEEKIYKNTCEFYFLEGNFKYDYLIQDMDNITRKIKVNFNIDMHAPTSIRQDCYMINFNDLKITLVDDEFYLLSKEFLSNFKNINILKKIPKEKLLEENSKNLIFINL